MSDAASSSEWWRSAVLYEIYVRSFSDSDGDGLGDLPGIRSRLPYVRELGVDGIWLTPFYPSPDADHGYDVSDHEDVDPRYGRLEDFDALLEDAHEHGLRVIVDIVPNHVSAAHAWFRNALDPGHPDRRRFLFRPGRDGGPPNNWESSFGGPAWTVDERSGEYYLHLFAPEQPDLDWHNDEVRADFERILRFWLDRGVDGFRIDVGHAIFKAAALEDVEQPRPRPVYLDWHTGIQQPELHDLYRDWRRLVDSYPGGRLLVGEIVLGDQAALAQFVRPDELHQAFNFSFLFEQFDASALRACIHETLTAFDAVGAAPTWVLENHDVTRLPTRYGGGGDGHRRARAAALLLLRLPGGVYLYAGQELGLEEVELAEEHRRDPILVRSGGARLGRDGCRVPIPWEPGAGLGFTTGTPWLPVASAWEELCVAVQRNDPDSFLSLYRAALTLRKASDALRTGSFAWRESPEGTLVFERLAGEQSVVCALNVSGAPLALPGEVLLASERLDSDRLPAGGAAWLV